MDERSFLTKLADEVGLLSGRLGDKRPLAEIITMIQSRRMNQKQFLELLLHKIDLATRQIAIHPALEDLSQAINNQLKEIEETESDNLA
jgi:hypothetical protein